jgi:phosphoribosylformylglycinamidine cyclo-ligase
MTGWRLDRHVEELARTVGEELLVPTHVYSQDCLALINSSDVDVHGFSHVTGGGLAANLDRVLPRDVDVEIDRSTWSPAPIFGLIGRVGGVEQAELERTLNMGVGMVAVIAKADADRALAVLATRGLRGWVAGTARPGTGHTELVGSYA